MRFDFTDVVRHIVEHLEPSSWQELPYNFTGQVSNDLSIGKRTIHAGTHRTKITLPKFRANRGAGKFTVGKVNSKLRRRYEHFAEIICSYLMPQAARAAVDADKHVIHCKFELPRDLRLINCCDAL